MVGILDSMPRPLRRAILQITPNHTEVTGNAAFLVNQVSIKILKAQRMHLNSLLKSQFELP